MLEAFDRLGSAGRAARELDISVSKVYRRLAALEQTLGFACLIRGAGVARLNETGVALAAVARKTSASIEAVRQEVRLAQDQLDGEVSLTTVEGFVPLVAPPLAALAQRWPRLRISLDVSFQGPSVRKREVDLALAVLSTPPEGLWGKKVLTIRYGVYGTRAAIAQEPRRWVVFGRPLHTQPQAAWERAHAKPVVLSTASIAAKIAFLQAGVGVGILPKRVAALHPDLLELPHERLSELERPAWLLTHPDLREVPRVRAVFDALKSSLASS